MTPEGSQSSEELLNTEENQSAAPSSSTSSSEVQIRVKDVTEINSNEAAANPSQPTKRKLPSWMLMSPQQSDTNVAKKKRAKDTPTNSAADEQPESTMKASTSGDSLPNDANSTASSSHTNAEENENAEIAENGAVQANSVVDTDGEAVAKEEVESETEPSGSASTSTAQGSSTARPVVKDEPVDDDDNEAVGLITPASPRTIKKAVKVEKEEATSSTTRASCKFGIRCYRQNPIHRREEAHPGDKDYRRPDFPEPPDGTPDCPYGDLCYRRNPVHFQQYSHPPSTDFQKNWKNHKMRLRQRKQPTVDPNDSYSDLYDEIDDFDLDDPFMDDDSDDEFIPNSYDDEEDDL